MNRIDVARLQKENFLRLTKFEVDDLGLKVTWYGVEALDRTGELLAQPVVLERFNGDMVPGYIYEGDYIVFPDIQAEDLASAGIKAIDAMNAVCFDGNL